MVTTYPKSGLQDRVAFQQNGKPGVYPVQAWNDEIGTFQFLSTLADGTVLPAGAAVVVPVGGDGIRLPAADDVIGGGDESGESSATAKFAGVVAFSYYTTVQSNGYAKAALDVNVPVKQKGYITVLMTSLVGAEFETPVTLDLSNAGKFKVAGAGDTVVGKINKVFPEYGTAEILLKEFI